VRSSNYGGAREIQVEWLGTRPAAEAAPVEVQRPAVTVVDYRGQSQPRVLLAQLQAERAMIVWREGPAVADLAGCDRTNLLRADALVVWTTPPGPAELAAALAVVATTTIYLFGLDPGMDELDVFLRRLAGLVKHALRARGGRVSVAALAAATAQREAAVRLGLAWLAERGDVQIVAQAGDEMLLAPGASTGADAAQTLARLRDLLAETAAYRAYFAVADKDRLVAG
jgi:single-stranded-DNA-specific exonuclease